MTQIECDLLAHLKGSRFEILGFEGVLTARLIAADAPSNLRVVGSKPVFASLLGPVSHATGSASPVPGVELVW